MDNTRRLSIHYILKSAQNQLNALSLYFDTPCSLPVISLLALISPFILSSFQVNLIKSFFVSFMNLTPATPDRKYHYITLFLSHFPSLSPVSLFFHS